MKLLTFRTNGEPRLGVVRDRDEVVEVDAPGGLLGLIDAGRDGLTRAKTALDSSRARRYKLADLELLAPLPEPRGDVLAIGRNYQKHAEEGARAWGEAIKPPTIFTKAQTSITGPYDDIRIDPVISDKIDWEVELGVVIGTAGANIRADDAMSHVFGYTVINDVSARDIQNGWGGQFFKGKSLDRSSPLGPWVVTADEIADPQALRVTLKVNGVVKQDGNTRDMIYPVQQLIVWLSVGMTLRPGNVIATGTPDGVGFARTPPEFLKPGDLMETEVAGVGLLRNKIVGAKVPATP